MNSPHRLFGGIVSAKKSFSILESVLHRWPAPPPVTHKLTAREDRQARWPNVKTRQPSTLLMCPWARHRIPSRSSSGVLELSLTSDLPVEGGRQKEIFPMGINKVSHYHLNAADCIFFSVHFSLQTFRKKCVIWPCHIKSPVSVGKGLQTQMSNDKETIVFVVCLPPPHSFISIQAPIC